MRLERRRLAGRYELAAPLERGPAATIWRARDRVEERDVAVQQIRFEPTAPSDEREHVRRWMLDRAQRSAAIRHPSVVPVHDVFEEDGALYVVTDHTPAPTLGDLLDLQGPLDEASVVSIGERLAAALAAIHAAGSVHGRMTVHHVLVPSIDEPRLSGVVPAADGSAGGDGYAPPEEREPDHRWESDPAADVWRLGATLHHAVEGRPPASGHGAELDDERTPALASLLDDLLAPDPGDRPPAAEVSSRFEQLRRQRLTGAAQEASEPVREGIPPHLRFDATGDLDDPGAGPGTHEAQATVADGDRPRLDTGMGRDGAPTAGVATGTADGPSGWRAKLLAASAVLIAMAGVAAALMIASDGAGGGRVGDAMTEAAAEGTDEVSRSRRTAREADGDAGLSTPPAADDDAPREPATVPDGWETYRTPQYRFAHPPDWNVQTLTSATTQFRDTRTGSYVRITTGGSGTDPVGEWRAYEDDFAARHGDYRRIRIEPLDVKGVEGAVWEYTYTDGGAELRAVNIKIPTGESGYAFNLQSKVEYWDDVGARLEAFLAAFEPAP